MNLEQQVCSLDLAKRLKELGVKQESLFYYQNNPYNDGQDCIDIMISEWRGKNNENTIINTECENDEYLKYSAFTSAELAEMLFNKAYDQLEKIGYLEITLEMIDRFDGRYYRLTNNKTDHIIDNEIQANCYAKLLIIFIENGLMELE